MTAASTDREPNPQRLLVSGADGFLGANLALSLADRFAVLGLFGKRPISLAGCTTAPCDPADRAALAVLVGRERPQWTIHCGPLASASWDLPETPFDAEEEARRCMLLAEACSEVGSRLTVISTDAVFAGPRLFHDEQASVTGRQPFARAARGVEQALEPAGALVVRTHAYGWGSSGTEPGFAERVWQSLSEAAPCRLDPHQHATPILATDLAELLWLAYRRGLEGLYHIAGAERTSAYRFAQELAAAFELRNDPVATDDEPPVDPEADHLHETSLSTRRARRALGRPMPMLREGLERFAEQATSGFRSRLRALASPVPQLHAA